MKNNMLAAVGFVWAFAAVPRPGPIKDQIEREIAGIRAGLEMGGVPFTAEAEAAARAVLNGEITGDEAIARGLAELNARTAQ